MTFGSASTSSSLKASYSSFSSRFTTLIASTESVYGHSPERRASTRRKAVRGFCSAKTLSSVAVVIIEHATLHDSAAVVALQHEIVDSQTKLLDPVQGGARVTLRRSL